MWYKKGIKSFEDQVTELDKQIIEAKKNITSVQAIFHVWRIKSRL